MAIKIKVKSSGKAKASSAPKRSAAKKGSATKGRAQAPAKRTAAKKQSAPRQSGNQAAIKRWESKLTKAGEKGVKTREAHTEAVQEIYEVAQAAIADGVPMTVVSATTGVSRQWLYQMGSHQGRNGKPATKRSSSKRGTATKATAKTAAKKSAAKKGAKRIVRKRGK